MPGGIDNAASRIPSGAVLAQVNRIENGGRPRSPADAGPPGSVALAPGSRPRPRLEIAAALSAIGPRSAAQGMNGIHALEAGRAGVLKTKLQEASDRGEVHVRRGAPQKLALGLTSTVQLGQAVGKASYQRGEAVGEGADFITKSQKTTGRDPGQFAYLNPLTDERFMNQGLRPIDLVNSLNGKPPANGQSSEAAQAIALNHLGKVREEQQSAAFEVLNNQKGGIFSKSNYEVVARAKAQAGLALGDSLDPATFDNKVVSLLQKQRPDLAQAYQASGGMQHRTLPAPTRGDLVKHYNALDQAGRRAFMNLAVVGHAKSVDPAKFGQVYMLKGDYAESDRSSIGKFINWVSGKSGEVVISQQLAEGKYSNSLHAWGYRTVAGATKHDANAGVVKEAMASDIARIFGKDRVGETGRATYTTQEAQVVHAKWNDGSPKLILGVKLLGREQAQAEVGVQLQQGAGYKDLEGRIVDGRMVDKMADGKAVESHIAIDKKTGLPKKLPQDLARGADGRPAQPLYRETPPGAGVKNLSAMIIKTGIALGDRDAMGGTGANKGSVGNVAGVIDPGHAWETKPLKMNDDFSFFHPGTETGGKADYQKKMKNFSVGDSATLGEKMRAVRDLQLTRESGDADRVFAEYRLKYPEYEAEINESQDAHEAVLSNIVGVFAKRLAVYDYGLPLAQVDQVFNLVDNLEKLTSNCDWRSENGLVELHRPRVTQNKNGEFQRTAWGIEPGANGSLVLSAKASDHDAANRLKAFIAQHPQNAPTLTEANGQLVLTIQPADLAQLSAWASDERVRETVKARDQVIA